MKKLINISAFFVIPIFCLCQNQSKFNLGDSYYQKNNFEKALYYYDQGLKAMDKENPSYSEIYFKKGYAQMQLYEYEKAIQSFDRSLILGEKYLKEYQKKQINEWKITCELTLKYADVREKLKEKPVKVNIKNLGKKINSKYDDYAPTLDADGLTMLFTSRRNTTTGGGVDLADGLFFEDFYYAKRTGREWGNAINLQAPVNTNEHESIPCISADGQFVYYYKFLPPIKKHNNKYCGNGDIYFSNLNGNKWSEPKLLPTSVNSEYFESQPSISSDGNVLYFISDRPDGIGGKDIYVSSKDKSTGKWTPAKNLGEQINTKYDEAAPFIFHDNKTLFFSTIGHPGMGRYDIFSCKLKEDGTWSEPKNMGYPLNSESDDVFFRMSASQEHAYISSVRNEGFGGMDIYEVDFIENDETEKIEENKTEEVKTECVVLLKGIIKEKNTGATISADIVLENIDQEEEISKFNSNSESGKYMVVIPAGATYGITINKDGYLFHSANINIPKANCEYREIIQDIVLTKLEVGKSAVLNNIFFESGKATLSQNSKLELNRLVNLLINNPSMSIEISGHTDSQGSEEINLELSKKRADNVMQYLIDKGIKEKMLLAKGYGETLPIAANINPDGSDNPEGRHLNRRIEFKIVSFK